MTSFGRGRGWRLEQKTETVLRRPGMAASPKHIEYTDVMNEINNIVTHRPISEAKLCKIFLLLQEIASRNDVRLLLEELHSRAVEDKQFGIKLAIPFSDEMFNHITDVDKKKLRNVLLSFLQTDFERRCEIKEESIMNFLNATSLLGEIYYRIRCTTDDSRLMVLETPLIICLQMVVECATEDAIILFATQIVNNGKALNMHQSLEMQKLMLIVRKILTNPNISVLSRSLLLFTIDIYSNGFIALSKDLEEFYISEIGAQHLIQMQRHAVNVSITLETNDGIRTPRTTSKEVHSTDVAVIDALLQNTCLENSIKQKRETVPIVPRAIRGLGAQENLIKRHNNHKKIISKQGDNSDDNREYSESEQCGD